MTFSVKIRSFYTSSRYFKSVNLKNIKGASSQSWVARQLTDPYVEKARMMNYRCRSAFKLIEIDERFKILKPGMNVIDCGASPGSWTQVAVKKINSDGNCPELPKGNIISIDRSQIFPIPGAVILGHLDFTNADSQKKILEEVASRKFDVVLSDMAPRATGVKELDNTNIVDLCYAVLRFAVQFGEVGSTVLVKLWQCAQREKLEQDLRRFYNHVKNVKPESSRSDSAEIFLLGRDFKGLK